jgi:hypothetical protein
MPPDPGSGSEKQMPPDPGSGSEEQMPPDPGSGSEEPTLRAYNEAREDQRPPPAFSCVNAVETERNLGREGATTVEGPSVLPSVGDSRLPLVSAGEFTCPVVSAGGDFTFCSDGNYSDRHASDRPPNSAYSSENCMSSGYFREEQPLIFWKGYPVLNTVIYLQFLMLDVFAFVALRYFSANFSSF